MYFRDDEEDKTGASMTHTMFDDQQVSTFVGQWNCFPGLDRCIQLICDLQFHLKPVQPSLATTSHHKCMSLRACLVSVA